MSGGADRIELMIERWSRAGATDFRWSIWQGGKRLAMGGPHALASESEAEARAACARALGRHPDRVTLL